MGIYTRRATCTTGHSIEISFAWDPDVTHGKPIEYSKPCPVSGCMGRVEFKLPVGGAPESLELKEAVRLIGS